MAPRATGLQPEYLITLSDGVSTIGIRSVDDSSLRRLPRGPGVERKTVRQKTFNGGRGHDRVAEDAARFFDARNMWTMVDGQAVVGPAFQFAKQRDQIINMLPVSLLDLSTTAGEYARSFVANAAYTNPIVGVWIWLQDSNVTTYPVIRIRSDSAGTPGSVLWSYQTVADDFPDTLPTWISRTTAVSLTNGVTYWISVETPNALGPFRVCLDNGVSGKRGLTGGGGSWVDILDAPLFYLGSAASDWNNAVLFEYKRGLYFVGRRAFGATELYLNGDRGVSSGGSTNTLTDSTKTWATDEWKDSVLVILIGGGVAYSSTIASNTATTLTTDDPINGAAGLEYVILGSNKWTLVTALPGGGAHGLASGINSVAIVNDVVYFARYEGGATLRRMREYNNAGVWTREFADDGTNDCGTWLLDAPHWDTGEASLYKANHIASTVQVAKKQPWGTNLTFEPAMDVGTKGTFINGIAFYNNMFWAGKSSGVFALKNGRFYEVPIAMRAADDERNCTAIIGWNTNLYFSLHDGLERLYGQVVDDIGPNRDMGLPTYQRGRFRTLLPVVQYMFGAYDAGLVSRFGRKHSSVLATVNPGGDWHNIFTALESGQRILTIHYQTVPGLTNRLWMVHGRELGWLDMPDDIHNPVNDTRMRHHLFGYVTTSWYDFESPELDHFFEEIRAVTRTGLLNLREIAVYYKLDSDEETDAWNSWTLIPSPGVISTSPYQRLPIGAAASLKTGRRIRFRLVFRSDTATPMVLNSFEMRGNQMNEVEYDLQIDFDTEDRLMLMSGSDETTDSKTIINVIEGWKEVAAPLTLRVAAPAGASIWDNEFVNIDPVSLVLETWDQDRSKLRGNLKLILIKRSDQGA